MQNIQNKIKNKIIACLAMLLLIPIGFTVATFTDASIANTSGSVKLKTYEIMGIYKINKQANQNMGITNLDSASARNLEYSVYSTDKPIEEVISLASTKTDPLFIGRAVLGSYGRLSYNKNMENVIDGDEYYIVMYGKSRPENTTGANLGMIDVPMLDLEKNGVTTLSYAFYSQKMFTGESIVNWDTSLVTVMTGMFYNNIVFNQPIGNWATSKVTEFSNMFYGAELFNQPINFDFSSAIQADYMFQNAKAFNQEVDFDFPKATHLRAMFSHATSLNKPIKISAPKVTHMSYLFNNSTSFNSSVEIYAPSVTNISNMFNGATAFNQPVDFDTSSVTDISSMFRGATAFNQPVDFDTVNVTSMISMFHGAKSFNQPINFNSSKVTSFLSMFNSASSFNSSVILDTSSAIDMSYMFAHVPNFNQSLESFDTKNVTNMSYMFYNSKSFNQELNFDTRLVKNFQYFLNNAQSFNQPVSHLDTSSATNMSYMFGSAHEFNQPISFNTSNVTDMSGMFAIAKKFNSPLEIDTSNVTNMSRMFYNAESFNQPLNHLNTSNVTNMFGVFNQAYIFNQDISGWDTSKVTSMSNMFSYARAFNQNLYNWDVSSVTGVTPDTALKYLDTELRFKESNLPAAWRKPQQKVTYIGFDGYEWTKEYTKGSVVNLDKYAPQGTEAEITQYYDEINKKLISPTSITINEDMVVSAANTTTADTYYLQFDDNYSTYLDGISLDRYGDASGKYQDFYIPHYYLGKKVTGVGIVPQGSWGDEGVTNLGAQSLKFSKYSEVKTIGDMAFTMASSITEVVIPASVESIGMHAFSDSGLRSLTFEEGSKLHSIGDIAFSPSPMTELTAHLPNSLVNLGSQVFNNYSTVIVDNYKTGINYSQSYEDSFNGANVTFLRVAPQITVTYVGFDGYEWSKDYDEGSIVNLDKYAPQGIEAEITQYYDETNKRLISPNNIAVNGDMIVSAANTTAADTYYLQFDDNYSTYLDGISLDRYGDAFGNYGEYYIPHYYLGKKVTGVGIAPQGSWGDEGVSSYQATGLEFSKYSEVKKIGDYAFLMASNLREVIIPASVEEIGNHAFSDTGLYSMTFGEGSKLHTLGVGSLVATGEEPLTVYLPASLRYLSDSLFYHNATVYIAAPQSTLVYETNYDTSFGSANVIFTSTRSASANLFNLGIRLLTNNYRNI